MIDLKNTSILASHCNVLLYGAGHKERKDLFRHYAQTSLSQKQNNAIPRVLGTYISCEKIKPTSNNILSEHFLIECFVSKTIESLEKAKLPYWEEKDADLDMEMKNIFLDYKRTKGKTTFSKLKNYFKRNAKANESFDLDAEFYNFHHLDLFLKAIRRTASRQCLCFSFFVDDLQALDNHQIKAINSLIGWQTPEAPSIKAAIENPKTYSMLTPSGKTLTLGHDYTRLDID